ncbi:hypothetical protein QBC46DRAFT_411848 [Diplogelasinospora grovesii]|uniref:Uncharacterized protein n=1 Tax=Diplogelasinospora grovesii TaxID=303347 RepID=A0AAN6N1Y6_9PEZI|nr:hypothetical protein QBC46DRAFT_411848 [Diplogelasinospora grovesii]
MSFQQNWVVPPSSPRPHPLVYEDPDDESSRLPNNVLEFAAPPIRATPPSPRPPQIEFSDDHFNYFDPPFQGSPKRSAEIHQESPEAKCQKSRRWERRRNEQKDLIHMAQSGDFLQAPANVDGYDPAAVDSARGKFRVYESPSFLERCKRLTREYRGRWIRRRNSLEVPRPVQPEKHLLQENKKPKGVSSWPIEHKKRPALRDLQMDEAKGKLTRLRGEVTNTTRSRRMQGETSGCSHAVSQNQRVQALHPQVHPQKERGGNTSRRLAR